MDVPTDAPSEPRPLPVPAAVLLFVLAALWVVPAAWCGYKLVATAPAAADAEKGDKPDADKATDKAALAATDVNRPSYIAVVVLAAVGAVCSLGGGLWLTARPPGDPRADARDRLMILLGGAVTGLLLMAVGVWFATDEYQLLADWLNRKQVKTRDLWRVIVPGLVFLVGTGVAFLAALPARRLERHDQTARRLVYGTNVLVTGLLLFAALVLVNGFVALRLPNRLDTTQTGYYTISPTTAEYVRTLPEKVTVYSIDQGQYGQAETLALLTAAQEANPSQFVVRFIGRSTSAPALQKLQAKFPAVDLNGAAMIVALGDDEKRYSAVRAADMLRRETGEGGPPRVFYEGETRLVRELLFLAEGQTKSTVYFTQGNGELALGGAGGRPLPDRSAAELKGYLEKLNLQVRPLPFDPKAGTLPDDAAVIVVADPTVPLGKELAAALQKYMAEPRADGKKGKLFVLAAPHPTLKGDGVQPTGLEDVLRGFNVQLAPAFLFNRPGDGWKADAVLGIASGELQQAGNPVARSLPAASRGLAVPFANSRAVEVQPTNNPAVQAVPVVETISGETYTWQETEPQADPDLAYKRLQAMAAANRRDTVAKMKVSGNPVPLAAVVTEGATPRLVVFGTADVFNDTTAAATRGNNPFFPVVSAGIDWLRDRPTVDVASKQYGFYTPAAQMSVMRLLFLPFLVLLLAVAGLAAGVWVVRRK